MTDLEYGFAAAVGTVLSVPAVLLQRRISKAVDAWLKAHGWTGGRDD